MLRRRFEEVQRDADAAFAREKDLEIRMKALAALLQKLADRCGLPQELRISLEGLLGSMSPADMAHLEDDTLLLPRRSSSSSSLPSVGSESDADLPMRGGSCVPQQAVDYPLSKSEKVVRLQQLFDNECKAAAQEARRLKSERSAYKSALRRRSRQSRDSSAPREDNDAEATGRCDFAARAWQLEQQLGAVNFEPGAEPPPSRSEMPRPQHASARGSEEPLALSDVPWASRPMNVLKELLSFGYVDDEEEFDRANDS